MPSNRVIIDTSAFYALISSTDEFHARAKLAYEGLLDEAMEVYTSSYIFTETAALIHHRLGFPSLERFVDSIRSSAKILWAGGRVHWEAWEILKQRQGRQLSFVDCTTAVFARELDAQVFTFDTGFQQEGFPTIPR